MAEVRGELEHLAVRVEATLIPVHDRSHREGVAQVVDTRASAMLVEDLRFAKPNSLARHREVISGRAIAKAFAGFVQKERPRTLPRMRFLSAR